jgi:tRNA(Ile)-lysidine synthase TilS/MesJ
VVEIAGNDDAIAGISGGKDSLLFLRHKAQSTPRIYTLIHELFG